MASLTRGVFIVAAKRTPFGTMGGKMKDMTVTDMQEVAFRAAMAAGQVEPDVVDSVVVGMVAGVSSKDAPYVSRHSALRAGVPIDVPALTVSRMCGSGFQSVVNGAHDIIMGDSRVVLTGGSENMSGSPFILRNMRYGTKLGQQYEMEDGLWAGLTDWHCNTPMGVTAENLSEKYQITRDQCEEFALKSQQRWKNANDKGYFKEEMAPVKITIKRKEVTMDTDEHPRPDTTLENMRKLPAVFKKNGTVTAATASGINDGAGCVILASEAALKEYNLKPMARLVGYGIAGVEPTIMGIGPVPAIRKLLKVTGKDLKDIDLVEINEAFASQTLSCQKELGLDGDKLNVNGGAIAIGHPVGASGSRITAHLVHELRRRGAKYGIGSACIGGGQGIALMIESM